MRSPPSSLQAQHGSAAGMKWIILGCVSAAILLLILILTIALCVRCRRQKSGYRDMSEDGNIRTSRSVPILSLKTHTDLGSLLRSRSTGHSPPSSATDISAAVFPQRDLSQATTPVSDSGSSLSLTDQYSPFQRSFHVENFPYLEFSTAREEEALTVVILSLCNIPDNVRAGAESTEGGFFLKAYLLPDEICHQTKVYRPTGSPSQDCRECLQFEKVRGNTRLLLSAYFIDHRHVRMSLGHTSVPTDLQDGQEQIYRARLEQLSQALHSNIGEVELTLTFLPDNSKLKVDVQSCKDLTLVDVRPTSGFLPNLLLRVQFLHGRKVVKERDFKITKLERNPRINEGCVFPLTPKRTDIGHLTFLLTEVIPDYEGTGEKKDRNIGRVDIGPYLYARGEGLMHWQSIVSKPKIPHFMSHFFEAPLYE